MNKTIKVIIIIFIISLLLESIIFNINSFRLFGKGYEEEELDLKQAKLNGMQETYNGYTFINNYASIEWENLNKYIGTIYINSTFSGNDRVAYMARIDYTDESAKYYNDEEPLQLKEIVNGVERTKYFTCYFSGKTR